MNLAIFLAAASGTALTPVLPPRGSDFAQRVLTVHNRARAAVGSPPLIWDERLAASAATYGPRLGALGRLVHSPRADRPGQRENLAMDLDWRGTPESLAGMWVAEQRHFLPGLFPQVTRTGRWEDVAHYTQLIWKSTTHVGCATYDAKGWRYLICRYSPPGNADGKAVP